MTDDDASVMAHSYPYALCRRRRGHLRPLSEESGGAQSALRVQTFITPMGEFVTHSCESL